MDTLDYDDKKVLEYIGTGKQTASSSWKARE